MREVRRRDHHRRILPDPSREVRERPAGLGHPALVLDSHRRRHRSSAVCYGCPQVLAAFFVTAHVPEAPPLPGPTRSCPTLSTPHEPSTPPASVVTSRNQIKGNPSVGCGTPSQS